MYGYGKNLTRLQSILLLKDSSGVLSISPRISSLCLTLKLIRSRSLRMGSFSGTGSGSNKMPGSDLEGCGPSQPWPALKLTPFHGADGADALQGIGQQWPSGRGEDDRQEARRLSVEK